MKKEIETKLNNIESLWRNFIWEYRFCSNKVRFNDDVKTNYVGVILGYFSDTLDVAFSSNRPISNSDKFSFSISLLQAIYIHQDFIEELLLIFKTNVNKGDLKQELTYSINRDLRNELIGHPIRKFEGKLISSTLFSYQAKQDEIEYLRYHRDNNFDYESKAFDISEIQNRHKQFLCKYLDVILSKLHEIMEDFLLELDKVKTVKENKDFSTLLTLVELYFESIFKSEYAYEKSSLLNVFSRRNEHIRYQNFIDCFYHDLDDYLNDTRKYINELFATKPDENTVSDSFIMPEIEFITELDDSVEIKRDYHYEIGKIATKRNLRDFEFFGGLLRSEFHANNAVISELDHMELNISDQVEYYTSLKLLEKLIEEH